MKYTVTIEGQEFEVEIDNLHTRPIIARIGEDVFEVMPAPKGTISDEEKRSASLESPVPHTGPKPSPMPQTTGDDSAIFAPIPGVIEKIMVSEGDTVSRGQELLILEAMKMKNAIRSPRDGKIAKISIAIGETVNHNDKLIEFEG